MSQSLSRVLVHGVFSTKSRVSSITPEVQPELYAYIAAILLGENHVPIKIGGHTDHLHMLFGLSRTMTIAKTIEKVKVSSSVWIKTKGLEFDGFAWQQGYGIFSVAESEVSGVKAYIENQADHHKSFTYQDEFRAVMKKHGIPIDEKYVWD